MLHIYLMIVAYSFFFYIGVVRQKSPNPNVYLSHVA